MSFSMNHRQSGDVTIIEAKGKITIGAGDVQMRTTIKDLITQGNKKLILNLQGVKYMDSSGVGELVSTYTSVSNAGGKLVLVGVTGKILDLLQITQLLQVFEVYTSVEEALVEI